MNVTKKNLFLTKVRLHYVWLSMLCFVTAVQGQSYEVGNIVENFTLINRANGEEVSLYDFEGKVIFLEWFAWWCPFCRAAAAEIGPGIVDYYEDRNGNPGGVPVMHVGLNLQGGAETSTQNFIDFYGLSFVLNDFNRAVANRFQSSNQPIFAIINGLANSPSHDQWELLYSHLGYLDLSQPIDEFRTAINSVAAAAEVPGYQSYLDDLGVAEHQRAETDDPDFDGVPNVFEYFSGTDALDTSSFSRPVNKLMSIGEVQYHVLEYVHNPETTDVSVEVQFSNHPDFNFLNASVPFMTELLEDGLEKVAIRSGEPAGAGSEFSRLLFSSNEQ
ncbi:MAG: TlpA disulfide reductase family protein [Verrucomicrobia bacterium]|nr:TlpA disulfide reductase family protein [Verrucomicrobiota bacterium]